MAYSEAMKKIMDIIDIPGADAIRGNITLPLVDGAEIRWKSSNTDVITDTDIGKLKAGLVTRKEEDTDVCLTATVSYNGEVAVKDINVHVVKASKPVTEDDFEGYLFGHFKTFSEYDPHNNVLTHSNSYRDVLCDMYIK